MRRVPLTYVVLGLVGAMLLGAGLILSREASTDEIGRLALGLTVVLTAALFVGSLAVRLGQPAVLGELLAGIILGNVPGFSALQLGTDRYLDILAQVGMLLLLFEVGLGLSVRDLFSVGPSSFLVALLGTAFSVVIGTAVATLVMPSAPTQAHVFLGAALAATSVGITARVLRDMNASRHQEAKIILGAAVVDDVFALVLLGAITAWAVPSASGSSPVASGISLIMKTAGFLVVSLAVGAWLTPAWFRQAARLRTRGALLAAGLCFCFLLSWAAAAIGMAALVGAFAAGLVLEDAHSELFVQRGERSLDELLQPMVSFLVPVFFVLVGVRTNVAVLAHPLTLAVPLALTAAAIVGKLACAGGVLTKGVKRMTVALGMLPRGEVTLVFAALGSTIRIGNAPLLDERGYIALVTVVLLTTLITPPALKWSLRARGGASAFTRPAA